MPTGRCFSKLQDIANAKRGAYLIFASRCPYKKTLLLLCAFWCWNQKAYGVGYKVTSGYWSWGIAGIKSSIKLPVQARTHRLTIPTSYLLTRAQNYQLDERIEPVYVNLKAPFKQSENAFVKAYARSPKHALSLLQYLRQKPAGILRQRKRHVQAISSQKIILNRQALDLINLEKFRQKYRTQSYDLSIETKQDKSFASSSSARMLLEQTKVFLDSRTWSRLQSKIREGRPIKVSQDLLPPFARKVIQRYSLYRGPNCFHTAMAFQEEAMLTMSHTNLRQEVRHHHLMINHDELWHILNWYFYEINPLNTPLNYGDVIVFFDVPTQRKPTPPAKYGWIVHASAYLFEGYVFSKGSKSPNTPYSIKTLAGEWQGWSRRTSNLAVKVFRRSFKDIRRKSPVVSRSSWLY